MADHLIGKIFVSHDNHDFMWDRSDPVLYGIHTLDIVGTNRWPYLTANVASENQYKDWPKSLYSFLEVICQKAPMLERTDGDNDLLPSCFSHSEVTFLDILVYIGVKINIFTTKDTTRLSRDWVDNEVLLIMTEYADTRLKSKLNKVISYLVSNQIRIGALCVTPISLYPESRFTLDDFPELEKLRFCCYSSIM